MTGPFTCRAIARPFARLAIARFYVYGLMSGKRIKTNTNNTVLDLTVYTNN